MGVIQVDTWKLLSEAYGFMGNSLLKPMNQTPAVGIEPAFWEEFPQVFTGDRINIGLQKLRAYASAMAEKGLEKATECTAVEYTHLFIGPPSPVAPPWETMNGAEEVSVGFGQATFDMRDILQEAGLVLSNENNQYEDHIGIELLYLSEMCSRVSLSGSSGIELSKISGFIEAHPLSWIETLREKVDSDSPEGYYSGLLELAEGVLLWHRNSLAI